MNTSTRKSRGRRVRPLATRSGCQLRAPRETLTATAVPPFRPQCRLVTRCREDCDWLGLSRARARARVSVCRFTYARYVGSFTRTHVACEAVGKERGEAEREASLRLVYTRSLCGNSNLLPRPLPTFTTTNIARSATMRDWLRFCVRLSPPTPYQASPTRSASPSTSRGCLRIVSF